MAGEMQELHEPGRALPGHDGALPGPLCDPGGGGGPAAGEDPLHHLQRRPVLRPHGDQGRPLLSADDCLPGRPLLPAGGQRPQAEPGQAADGLSAGVRRERRAAPCIRPCRTTWRTPSSRGPGPGSFVSLVEAFSAGYEGRPVSEVLSALLNESGYEADAPHRGQPGAAGQPGGAEAVHL